MTVNRSTPTCRQRRRVDHHAEPNRRPGLAPVRPILAKHLDLQAQHAYQRACALRHHAAGDVETSGAHFEIQARKKRQEYRMTGSLIAPRHCHSADIDDLAPGFDDHPARLFGGKRTGRQHETASRDRLFTIPPEQVYRSHVVPVPLAAFEAAVTRIVIPTLFDHGLVAQTVRCMPRHFIVSQREAILRAGENCTCEGIK